MRGELISDHGLFSFHESQQGAANEQDSRGVFQGCTGLWTAGGCWLACRLHQIKVSPAMDHGYTFVLQYYPFLYSCIITWP